jgi:hypothetical protein
MTVSDDLLSATPASPIELTRVHSSGIYAWWGSDVIPWPVGFPPVDLARPAYVGIAASQTLAERAQLNHLGRTRGSGLRRSLTGLLLDAVPLRGRVVVTDARRPAKFGLDAAGERALTAWMVEHLRVTWVPLRSPGAAEEAIIRGLTPPLNDTHASGSPYRVPLRRLRAAAATSV